MACQVALISDTVFSVLPLMSILHLLVESELVCVEEDCFPHSKVPSEEDGPAGEIKQETTNKSCQKHHYSSNSLRGNTVRTADYINNLFSTFYNFESACCGLVFTLV